MGKQRNFEHMGPATRGKRSIPVNMLGPKYCGMAEYLGFSPTLAGLAEALDIAERTLSDAVSAGGCTKELMDRLELAMKQRHGKVFSQSWKEWRDPDENPKKPPMERSDAADLFLDKLRRENSGARQDGKAEAPTPGLLVAIAAGPRQAPIHCIAPDLASVAVEGSQYGFGTVAIEGTVLCGIWQGSMIQSGRISLSLTPAAMTPDSFKGWVGRTKTLQKTAPDGSEGTLLLAFGGTRLAPYWRVTAIGGGIGTFSVGPDLAAIEDLAPGGRMTATFGTWLSEIEDADETGDSDNLIVVDDRGNELKIPPAELSKKKRRVISSIRKAILNAGPDGYVELASHALVVVEKKP